VAVIRNALSVLLSPAESEVRPGGAEVGYDHAQVSTSHILQAIRSVGSLDVTRFRTVPLE